MVIFCCAMYDIEAINDLLKEKEMRKTSTVQILAMLLAVSGMVSLVGCETTSKSTSTRENISGTSQEEIANSESKSNLSEEQIELLENDFPQEAMVPTE